MDGSGEIKVAEFAELLFPEVEGMDDDEDEDGSGSGEDRAVVSDPVLMKLIMQEKTITEMAARITHLCDALERTVANGENVNAFSLKSLTRIDSRR